MLTISLIILTILTLNLADAVIRYATGSKP